MINFTYVLMVLSPLSLEELRIIHFQYLTVERQEAAIFAAWEDWNPSWGQGVIRYETLGGIPNRYLVVEYDSVYSFNCGGGPNQRGVWQIILRENSNQIELHTAQKPQCNTLEGLQGIHDETGTIAFTVNGRNDSIWSTFNEGILFYT